MDPDKQIAALEGELEALYQDLRDEQRSVEMLLEVQQSLEQQIDRLSDQVAGYENDYIGMQFDHSCLRQLLQEMVYADPAQYKDYWLPRIHKALEAWV
jgi:hypothetical protein